MNVINLKKYLMDVSKFDCFFRKVKLSKKLLLKN